MKVFVCRTYFHGDEAQPLAVFKKREDAEAWSAKWLTDKSPWCSVKIERHHIRSYKEENNALRPS